jgi:hypothetical protein
MANNIGIRIQIPKIPIQSSDFFSKATMRGRLVIREDEAAA